MGGTGSGRYSVRSKAFDICDFAQGIISHVQRSLHQDPERPITFEVVQDWKNELENKTKQLTKAIESEKDADGKD